MALISQNLIENVSMGPSEATESSLRSTRDKIVELLGTDYEVFLQGSYKNDTAISNINDIDIVAVRIANVPQSWEQIFDDIIARIASYTPYRLGVSKGQKCINLNLQGKHMDIVPACRTAASNNQYSEPIFIFNRRTNLVINNYPKTHYANGSTKNQNTNQKYKKVVRLIKNFANNHNLMSIGPSFYLECLIYGYPVQSFNNDLISSFYGIIWHICYGQNFNYQFVTVAGDKLVISDSEWPLQSFNQFKAFLAGKTAHLANAIAATNQTNADYYFRQFFNL